MPSCLSALRSCSGVAEQTDGAMQAPKLPCAVVTALQKKSSVQAVLVHVLQVCSVSEQEGKATEACSATQLVNLLRLANALAANILSRSSSNMHNGPDPVLHIIAADRTQSCSTTHRRLYTTQLGKAVGLLSWPWLSAVLVLSLAAPAHAQPQGTCPVSIDYAVSLGQGGGDNSNVPVFVGSVGITNNANVSITHTVFIAHCCI